MNAVLDLPPAGQVGMFDAKTHFSRIVDDVVSGRIGPVPVMRRGKAAVFIVSDSMFRAFSAASGSPSATDRAERSAAPAAQRPRDAADELARLVAEKGATLETPYRFRRADAYDGEELA